MIFVQAKGKFTHVTVVVLISFFMTALIKMVNFLYSIELISRTTYVFSGWYFCLFFALLATGVFAFKRWMRLSELDDN
jgi:hypothetical protein